MLEAITGFTFAQPFPTSQIFPTKPTPLITTSPFSIPASLPLLIVKMPFQSDRFSKVTSQETPNDWEISFTLNGEEYSAAFQTYFGDMSHHA